MKKFLYRKSDNDTKPMSEYENLDKQGLIGKHELSWLNDNFYVVVQILPPKIMDKSEFEKQGGTHLGTIRNWIKWNCLNGDWVTWNSMDFLKFKDITVWEFEKLAIDIAYNVLKEKGLLK